MALKISKDKRTTAGRIESGRERVELTWDPDYESAMQRDAILLPLKWTAHIAEGLASLSAKYNLQQFAAVVRQFKHRTLTQADLRSIREELNMKARASREEEDEPEEPREEPPQENSGESPDESPVRHISKRARVSKTNPLPGQQPSWLRRRQSANHGFSQEELESFLTNDLVGAGSEGTRGSDGLSIATIGSLATLYVHLETAVPSVVRSAKDGFEAAQREIQAMSRCRTPADTSPTALRAQAQSLITAHDHERTKRARGSDTPCPPPQASAALPPRLSLTDIQIYKEGVGREITSLRTKIFDADEAQRKLQELMDQYPDQSFLAISKTERDARVRNQTAKDRRALKGCEDMFKKLGGVEKDLGAAQERLVEAEREWARMQPELAALRKRHEALSRVFEDLCEED